MGQKSWRMDPGEFRAELLYLLCLADVRRKRDQGIYAEEGYEEIKNHLLSKYRPTLGMLLEGKALKEKALREKALDGRGRCEYP